MHLEIRNLHVLIETKEGEWKKILVEVQKS
jgi:hypothetical protein